MSLLDFTPKSIADIVVSSPQSRATLDQIIAGQYALRTDRSTVILLSGPYGTGKTTLARFLPGVIEQAYFTPGVAEHDVPYRYIDCRQGGVGASFMDTIEDRIVLFTPPNASRHYIICDEIDRLSSTAQEKLFALTFLPGVVWILTTNHRSRIDVRLCLDGVDLFLDSPNDSKIAALATNIANQHGVRLSDSDAANIAKACLGSWRQVHERTLQCIGVPRQAWNDLTRACERSRLIRFGQSRRPIKSVDDLTPQYIDEMVFADSESAEVAARIAMGVIQPPVDQGMGILIFGHSSTGRKTLAKLLPEAIEEFQYQSRDPLFECDTFICRSGAEGLAVIRKLNQLINQHVFSNRSGLRYITLVGVDALSAGAQQDLKSLMNTRGAVFILIANGVVGIDAGVLDRCRHRIYMPLPTSVQRQKWITCNAQVLNFVATEEISNENSGTSAGGFQEMRSAIVAAGLARDRSIVMQKDSVAVSS